MIFLIAFVVLHVLCWGTVGAVLSPRAGLPVVGGAVLCVLLPVIGAMVLAGMAIWGAGGTPALQHYPRWLRSAWIGVAAGVLVAAAAVVPWVELAVSGEVGSVDEDVASFAAADYAILPALLVFSGASMAVFAWLARRRGNREWLAGSALFAWTPAALGALLILSEGFFDTWVGRANSAGDVLSEQDVVEVGVGAEYQIGAGPYVALVGGLAALGWGFAWSLRRADGVNSVVVGAQRAWPSLGRSGTTTAAVGGLSTVADDWADAGGYPPPGAVDDFSSTGYQSADDEWSDARSNSPDDDQNGERWW